MYEPKIFEEHHISKQTQITNEPKLFKDHRILNENLITKKL
jgi:hypothetical protein